MKLWNAVKRTAVAVMDKANEVYVAGKNYVVTAVAGGAAALGLSASQPAHAELDTAVATALTTAFTGAVEDATELQALVIPAIIGIMVLTIVIKLIKRFGNKI